MRAFVVAVAALVAASSAWAAGTRPALRVVADAPLTLSGSGFQAGERVRVVVKVPAYRTAVRRASPTGRFTVRFQDAGCVGGMLLASAKGLASGRTAAVRRLGPACPPA